MRKQYRTLGSEREAKHELAAMGIDIFEPETRSDVSCAEAFDAFSRFVLHEEKERCLEILEEDLRRGGRSVGELQGGTEDHGIYRLSFPAEYCEEGCDGDHGNAALRLIEFYNEHHRGNKHSLLTVTKIKSYMLGMCDRRTYERSCETYGSLGNVMLIMQFGGPTDGQVRHIDNMLPNIQICLYMTHCPSTVIYAMDDEGGLPIADCALLLEFWERQRRGVPKLVRDILLRHGDLLLKSKWYTKYFSWGTLNTHFRRFGKLYQPVAYQLGVQAGPGTTMLAGGNDVHAGPPTMGSRMFAFAVGIPAESSVDLCENNRQLTEEEDNEGDGEVQYSPVLLHIDFCCLLFSILDNECENNDNIQEAKYFLVHVLIDLIKETDYPIAEYLVQIEADRVGVRAWLESLSIALGNGQSANGLVEEAVHSVCIFYSPDVIKRMSKKRRARLKLNKKSSKSLS